MATSEDVFAAIEHVEQYTGNPKWIRHQHPDLLNPTTGELIFPARTIAAGNWPATPQPDEAAYDRQEGNAADAIRDAEAALAHQNSATAQLDLQVITAVLNAHQEAVEGGEALNALQRDIEAVVRTRSDLDTPAGARDFQRFLIGKLRDIRAVIANASLDDTSKSALMAALTSLYESSQPGDSEAAEGRLPQGALANSSAEGAGQCRLAAPVAGVDPYLESLLADDPGLLSEDMPAQVSSVPAPATPAMPNIPSFGGGAMPGAGPGPGGMPGWAMPSGSPLPGQLRPGSPDHDRVPGDLDDALLPFNAPDDEASSDKHGNDQGGQQHHDALEPTRAEPPASGPTTVTLPNGETVTAASPELGAVIKAAVGGTPIADAFRQQGITIPPPGTAVSDPVDPSQVSPGDIGMFTNRHALALGQSKALLNGQIQHISTVNGPSFLGWEHPPTPITTTAPARTEPPAPTRPATAGRP
ncbi:MAG: DUF4226 domain-containing protein [Mycobacterium sp.]|nr:DUF4226 domain-containing protein [Mycobacterium sp.]